MEFKAISQPVFANNQELHCVETCQYLTFEDFLEESMTAASNGANFCYIYSMTNSIDEKTVDLENRRVFIRRKYVE